MTIYSSLSTAKNLAKKENIKCKLENKPRNSMSKRNSQHNGETKNSAVKRKPNPKPQAKKTKLRKKRGKDGKYEQEINNDQDKKENGTGTGADDDNG